MTGTNLDFGGCLGAFHNREIDHGYHHSPYYSSDPRPVGRRRLVRSRSLVLKRAERGLERATAEAPAHSPLIPELVVHAAPVFKQPGPLLYGTGTRFCVSRSEGRCLRRTPPPGALVAFHPVCRPGLPFDEPPVFLSMKCYGLGAVGGQGPKSSISRQRAPGLWWYSSRELGAPSHPDADVGGGGGRASSSAATDGKADRKIVPPRPRIP